MTFSARSSATVARPGPDGSGRSRSLQGGAAHLLDMTTDHVSADNPWGLECLLDIKDLAEYLGLPVSTVYDWRTRGLGPPAYRFGKHLKFAVSDVRAWMDQQRDPQASAPAER